MCNTVKEFLHMLLSAREAVSKYNMLAKGDKVIVGVSGGADSVCLLLVLHSMATELELELTAVHVNHGLRGKDADDDEEFTLSLCRKLGVGCRSFHYDVAAMAKERHLTTEEAGRLCRREAFESVAKELSANKIATAHHLNDNCETVLFNLIRGSGITGLVGIRPVRGMYIRPLIETSREEIEEYLKARGVTWCTDKTNNQTVYSRNKIRLELLPYIKQNMNPSVEDALGRLSAICADDLDFIEGAARSSLADCTVSKNGQCFLLNKEGFNALHVTVRRTIIRIILDELAIPLKDVHLVHIDNCLKMLAQSESGAFTNVGRCRVSLEHDNIRFSQGDDAVGDYEYTLPIGGSIFIPQINATVSAARVEQMGEPSANRIYISGDDVTGDITVRNRRSGDRFSPLGMAGSKKLKEYFIDRKIPLSARNIVPIFVNNNRVIWVGGHVMSEQFKICHGTQRIIMLEIVSQQ